MVRNDPPTTNNRRRWLYAGLTLLLALSLLCLAVGVPAAVRALPGRYAARLPVFLQTLRHNPHPATLPTPDLAALASPPPPTIEPTPVKLSGVTFATSTQPPSAIPIEPTTPATPDSTAAATDVPATPMRQPTATAPPPATPTPPPTVEPIPTPANELPVRASLPPLTHTHQTWNNCGPATLVMALSVFHRPETQADAAAFLKPDPEDKNVSPHEMTAYVRSLGLGASLRVDGNLTRLKQLIAAGFPVLVETWFIPEPGDEMGHYRLLSGYDDDTGYFTTQDSYNGPNVQVSYAELDELWRTFNRVYLVVYPLEREDELAAILGPDLDDYTMYTQALATAQAELANPPESCVAYKEPSEWSAFAWFNIGSNLLSLGRHEEAAAAYDQARLVGLPWRMLWYQFGPYEAYYRVGRYDEVVNLANAILNVTANLEESYYWRGMARLAQGQTEQAKEDFHTALQYNQHFAPAAQALQGLQ